jgi:hypothetical protein
MYVQIDQEMRDSLQSNVVAVMMMGSYAHGLNDDDSDKDILYLYYDESYGQNIYWESNGWQYKTDGVDENYQEIRVFIRNLITAKMCGNLEALLGGWTIRESLSQDARNSVSTLLTVLCNLKSYALAKSYVGYAKKDIKSATNIFKQARDKAVESREFRKRIAHIARGMNTIGFLMGEEAYEFFKGSDSVDYHMARGVKSGTVIYDTSWYASFIEAHSKDLQDYRNRLNEKLDKHSITRRGESPLLHRINTLVEESVRDLTGTKIDYNHFLRLDIIEKGETHQYI